MVGELRSHMPDGQKKTQNIEHKPYYNKPNKV